MREVQIHPVRRDDPPYSAVIGRGMLRSALADLEQRYAGRRLFVVTDAHVRAAGHLATLVGGRPVGQSGSAGAALFVIEPPGEVSKNMRTVLAILDAMEREKFGRDSLLVALGGGTVGDIGGFAAGIFKRGIPCAQAPTTTVSQADSAIGGKLGVDSALSKNAYGLIRQPARVYVDVTTLATMDERGYRAGLVESVKHALIADEGYFGYLEANLDRLLARDEEALEEIAGRNITIKARIVEQDPEEKGLRRVLNYGHTVGHAIEAMSGFRLLHGEALALGILAAARMAEAMGLADGAAGGRAAALLRRLGMPEKRPAEISDAQIADAMSRDKKSVAAAPRFVLLDRLGHVHRGRDGECAVAVAPAALAKALDAIRP